MQTMRNYNHLQEGGYFFFFSFPLDTWRTHLLIQDALHQQTLHITHIDVQLLKTKGNRQDPNICTQVWQLVWFNIKHDAQCRSHCVRCAAKVCKLIRDEKASKDTIYEKIPLLLNLLCKLNHETQTKFHLFISYAN